MDEIFLKRCKLRGSYININFDGAFAYDDDVALVSDLYLGLGYDYC